MTKILLGLLVAISIYASEPIQYGAYYGDIKEKMTNISSYPENSIIIMTNYNVLSFD